MIRHAKKEDSKKGSILIENAIHDIANMLTGKDEHNEVIEGLRYYFERKRNRLSHENIIVKEINGEVVGLVLSYHGKDAHIIDKPIEDKVREIKNDPEFKVDKEADIDEYYIDTLSVDEKYQGRGIAKELIKSVEEKAKNLKYNKLALCVDVENYTAFNLYKKLGYEVDKDIYINEKKYYHMVKYID